MLSASRPKRDPARTSKRRRSFGRRDWARSASVGNAVTADSGAATSTRLNRSASPLAQRQDLSVAALQRDGSGDMQALTDSRWVNPLRRMASASALPTEFWSPVASAVRSHAGSRQPVPYMAVEPVAYSLDAAFGRRPTTVIARERASERPIPLNQGVAGQNLTARQSHRRRWSEAARASKRAPLAIRRCRVLLDRDPDARQQTALSRRHVTLRSPLAWRSPPRDGGAELGDQRPLQPRRCDIDARNPTPSRSQSHRLARTTGARSLLPPWMEKPVAAKPAERQRKAIQSLGPSRANQATIPVPSPTTNHGDSCPRSRSRNSSTLARKPLKRVSQKLRARCGSGASPMLGALVHCIPPDKTKESA